MNENNLDPSSNAAFSNTSAQSNPFTGELKGEFSSDFGTSTNAVSQIFKGGGFGAQNKSRLILIGVVAVVVLVFAFWYFNEPIDETGSSEVAEEAGEEGEGEEGMAEGEEGAKPAEEMAEASKAAEAAQPKAEAVAETAPAAPMAATGSINLISPANGAAQPYDETSGPAEFQWEGAADQIVFSRSSTMEPVVLVGTLNGASSYTFENPYPGTWYWQVKSAAGASEVRSFKISAPPRRSFPVTAPTPGGSLAGTGGVVSWQAGEKIARYSVELTPAGSSFANPPYRFGTSGTSVALQGVPAGVYDVRVGAFSEVAGRWEWQMIEKVNIQ
jgi:hypothetical protein